MQNQCNFCSVEIPEQDVLCYECYSSPYMLQKYITKDENIKELIGLEDWNGPRSRPITQQIIGEILSRNYKVNPATHTFLCITETEIKACVEGNLVTIMQIITEFLGRIIRSLDGYTGGTVPDRLKLLRYTTLKVEYRYVADSVNNFRSALLTAERRCRVRTIKYIEDCLNSCFPGWNISNNLVISKKDFIFINNNNPVVRGRWKQNAFPNSKKEREKLYKRQTEYKERYLLYNRHIYTGLTLALVTNIDSNIVTYRSELESRSNVPHLSHCAT